MTMAVKTKKWVMHEARSGFMMRVVQVEFFHSDVGVVGVLKGGTPEQLA